MLQGHFTATLAHPAVKQKMGSRKDSPAPRAPLTEQEELDAQLEAVFGTADINSGKTLTLTEFMQALQASQIKQLRSRPTMKQAAKGAGAAAVAGGGPTKVAAK